MQLGNGQWETTLFNNRLQPTQLGLGTTSAPANTDLWRVQFEYGNLDASGNTVPGTNNGNISKQTIKVPSVTTGGQTATGFTAVERYVYDSLNRLSLASENLTPEGGTQVIGYWQQTFQYDRFGNRTFDTSNGQTTTLPAGCQANVCNPSIDPSNNQFTAGQGYSYDGAGNLKQDALFRKYTYDGENKQTRVQTVDGAGNVTGEVGSYSYDGDGRRVKKVTQTETTVFVYDATGKVVAEYSTAAPPQTPQTSYLTTDHLGSPRVITDQNGNVTSKRDFLPFGEDLSTSQRTVQLGYSADNLRQRFTGYEKDTESDLEFAQARYYNHNHGRFTSVDPTMSSADIINPQTFNRYAYVGNNPINITDPTGEIWGVNGNSLRWFVNATARDRAGFGAYNALVGMVDGRLVVLSASSAAFQYAGNAEEALRTIAATGAGAAALEASASALGLTAASAATILAGKASAEVLGKDGICLADPAGCSTYQAYRFFNEALKDVEEKDVAAPDTGDGQTFPADSSSIQPHPEDNKPDTSVNSGGGKDARKSNPDRVASAKDAEQKARGELNTLRSKPNKTPADKQEIKRLEREVQKQVDRQRKSESHGRKGKGN